LILYMDTSCLAKLYLLEEGSVRMRESAFAAGQVTTSKIAYAETRATLARALREGRIDNAEFDEARQKFEREWPDLTASEVSDSVLQEAGNLVDKHPIRGFDAIHLASAEHTRAMNIAQVVFATADRRLRDAADAEGFALTS